MKNLVARYYLTRELFKLRQMRDELLKAIPLAAKIPCFRRNPKATREFFLTRAEFISCGIEFLTNALDELAGDDA